MAKSLPGDEAKSNSRAIESTEVKSTPAKFAKSIVESLRLLADGTSIKLVAVLLPEVTEIERMSLSVVGASEEKKSTKNCVFVPDAVKSTPLRLS